MCYSYICLGEEGKKRKRKRKRKKRRCVLHLWQPFFSFFSKFVTIVIFIENCPKLNEFFEIFLPNIEKKKSSDFYHGSNI
jgi:hypothetical protein